VKCAICLYADHGNQTIFVHRYHIIYGNTTTFNYGTFFIQQLVECAVTQPTVPWLRLKNVRIAACVCVHIQVLAEYNKSVVCYENALRIQPDFEPASRRRHAVLCHAKLETVLETQHR